MKNLTRVTASLLLFLLIGFLHAVAFPVCCFRTRSAAFVCVIFSRVAKRAGCANKIFLLCAREARSELSPKYFGDEILMRINDVICFLSGILLALVFIALLGKNGVILALGIVFIRALHVSPEANFSHAKIWTMSKVPV